MDTLEEYYLCFELLDETIRNRVLSYLFSSKFDVEEILFILPIFETINFNTIKSFEQIVEIV